MMASLYLIGFWSLAAVSIVIAGFVHENVKYLPQIFKDVLLYGKVRGTKKRTWTPVQLLEIPKSWFFHFYLVGLIVNSWVLYQAACAYLLGQIPNPVLTTALDWLNTHPHVAIDSGTTLLLLAMMVTQDARRMLECFFVSIYSNTTMNLAHYLLGFLFYTTFPLIVLMESPSLQTYRVHDLDKELLGRWRLMLGLGIFMWASYSQNHTHKTLANLRQNSQGKIVDRRHHIPIGQWFEFISSPNDLMEVIIYSAMMLCIGSWHLTFIAFYAFVLLNRATAAYMTHKWYLRTFPKYPKNRTVLIPMLF